MTKDGNVSLKIVNEKEWQRLDEEQAETAAILEKIDTLVAEIDRILAEAEKADIKIATPTVAGIRAAECDFRKRHRGLGPHYDDYGHPIATKGDARLVKFAEQAERAWESSGLQAEIEYISPATGSS